MGIVLLTVILLKFLLTEERCGKDVDVVTSLCAVLEEITDRQLVL